MGTVPEPDPKWYWNIVEGPPRRILFTEHVRFDGRKCVYRKVGEYTLAEYAALFDDFPRQYMSYHAVHLDQSAMMEET